MSRGALLLHVGVLLAWTAGPDSGSARCVHDLVQPSDAPTVVLSYAQPAPPSSSSQPRGAFRAAAATTTTGGGGQQDARPMRIHVELLAEELGGLQAEESTRLQASVQAAVRRVSELLAVIPVSGPLRLSRTPSKYCKSFWPQSYENGGKCSTLDSRYTGEMCLEAKIPEEHLLGYSTWGSSGSGVEIRGDGPGVLDSDFILYVRAADTLRCAAGVTAYAAYCQLDQVDRPVAAAATFCPASLRGDAFNSDSTVLAVIHELFHALGFSKDLYRKWRDCSDSALALGRDCSPRAQVTNEDAHGQQRVFTPAVLRTVQHLLACNSSECGGVLEDVDGSSVPSSHWEARALQGSIMTASLGAPGLVLVDTVTLAALEDTGWYRVDYSRAEPLVWGRDQGGDFGLVTTCSTPDSPFFCQGSGLGCHYLHLHKGRCDTDSFLNGCRIYKPLVSKGECWLEANAPSVAERNSTGEVYLSNSRCFFSNLSRQGVPSNSSGLLGRCYAHRCLGEEQVEVRVGDSGWTPCPAGSSIQVPGYDGMLMCPTGRLCRDYTSSTTTASTTSTTTTTTTIITTRTNSTTTTGPPAKSTVTLKPSLSAASRGCAALIRREVTVLGVAVAFSLMFAVSSY
ncbi:ciliated left-right organizer metallopeptidase [Lampetra fluviatilis]